MEKIMQLYRERKISSGKARELLNVDFDKWLEIMKKENLYFDYDKKDLKEDLKTNF